MHSQSRATKYPPKRPNNSLHFVYFDSELIHSETQTLERERGGAEGQRDFGHHRSIERMPCAKDAGVT